MLKSQPDVPVAAIQNRGESLTKAGMGQAWCSHLLASSSLRTPVTQWASLPNAVANTESCDEGQWRVVVASKATNHGHSQSHKMPSDSNDPCQLQAQSPQPINKIDE
jgi:hypothetical protein